jgi:S-adenosyl-L-methionine hydrolase (adenosine-forming)
MAVRDTSAAPGFAGFPPPRRRAIEPAMIVLFTDFGTDGPYVGQMKAVLHRDAPGVPVIDLFADAPAAMPKPSAYLLAAYGGWFPPGSVLLAVVDPGVGGSRRAVVVEADGRFLVGPDNGLFELVLRRARTVRSWEIVWRPPSLSASFHGRDLFAPMAAQLAHGPLPRDRLRVGDLCRRAEWPDELSEIVYIDHFGNAMTGIRAAALPDGARLDIGGRWLRQARTFSDVPTGEPFWYENANGLAEVALNGGRAATALKLAVGSPVAIAA